MNQSVSPTVLKTGSGADHDDDSIDWASYVDLLVESRWLIVTVAVAVTILGATYSFITTPVYQSNILVQVEDNAGSTSMMLGELAGAFEMKSAATAEIEILRSRFVISRAVTNAKLDLIVEPKRFPIFGAWLARNKEEISESGIFGVGGYTWGGEKLELSKFSIPSQLEGEQFVLTVVGGGKFLVTQDDYNISATGIIGQLQTIPTSLGPLNIQVTQLAAKEGAQFLIKRAPMLETVEQLQKKLTIGEKGKQSGIISVSLEGNDRVQTVSTLNEIGYEYIKQNVERKSAEAEKSLAFLEKQLPELKKNLENAEATYNQLRNRRGTVDLSEEAKAILQQSVLSQTKLVELKQKKDELLTRYQESNPLVKAIDEQMRTLNVEIGSVNNRIKQMPSIEQDVLRLTRDVKVNTDLYTSLLNSAQQLKLVKASKVGNVRLLDEAIMPRDPIRPQRALVVVLALFVGTFLGVLCAYLRKSFFGGVEDPSDIERMLGLSISAAIPHSSVQNGLIVDVNSGAQKTSLLATSDPTDLAIESLRSLRTSLQFSMLGATNNIIMITGPTPSVGKSFISANFAAVLAAAGKRILLIDGDLRKGYLQRYFGLNRDGGLSEVISGAKTFSDAVHRNVVERVDFLSTGVLPPHPAELLEHPNLAALLKDVIAQYDAIVLDTAPILAVADGLIIAPHVGTIFNVVRSDVSTIGEIDETVKRIEKAGRSVTGIVFNDLKQRIGGYGFGSKYGRYRYAHYKY